MQPVLVPYRGYDSQTHSLKPGGTMKLVGDWEVPEMK